MRDTRLILALDGLDWMKAMRLVERIGRYAYAVKIHDLVDKEGPGVIGAIKRLGAPRVWVDHKLHDIPKTVARRAKALKAAGADILTVHASGGSEMMEAAVASGAEVLAVTVLTSLDKVAVDAIYGCDPEDAVRGLAILASRAGVAGFVCSALELETIKDIDQRFKRVVPGTRSAGVAAGEQKRSATPVVALRSGASHLVIASQVTEADHPLEAWQQLVAEISEAQDN